MFTTSKELNKENNNLHFPLLGTLEDVKTSLSQNHNFEYKGFMNKNQLGNDGEETVYLKSHICRFCGEVYSADTMLNMRLVKDEILEHLHIKVDSNNYLSNMLCKQCMEKLENFKQFMDKFIEAEKKQLDIIKSHQNSCPFCYNDDLNKIIFVSSFDFLEAKNKHLNSCIKNQVLVKNNTSDSISVAQTLLYNTRENEFKQHTEKHLLSFQHSSTDQSVFNSEILNNYSSSKLSAGIKQLPGSFQCELCSKSFKSKKRIEFHIGFHLQGSNAGYCNLCKKEYLSEIHFYKHVQHSHVNRKTHICDLCGKGFRNKSSLKYHSRSHKSYDAMKPFLCKICNKRFARKNILEDHMISQHNVEMDCQPNTCFQCRICKESFPNTNSGISHMEIHHQNKIDDNTGYSFNMQTVYKLYVCEYCEKCYTLLNDLKEHRVKHSEPLKNQCKMCNEEFKSFAEMKTHLAEHVADGMVDYKSEFEIPMFYICKFCQKSFRSHHALSNHNKSHAGTKPYSCQFCSEVFSSLEEQQEHQISHKNIENFSQPKNFLRPFKCQFCNKSFTCNSLLTKHVRIHTGEKPFQCQYCAKSFTQSSGLNTHYKVHSNERPYKCELCGKSYKIIGDYKKHVKRHASVN